MASSDAYLTANVYKDGTERLSSTHIKNRSTQPGNTITDALNQISVGTGSPNYSAPGDLNYGTGVATGVNLPIGTAGTHLRSTGTAPFWSNNIDLTAGSLGNLGLKFVGDSNTGVYSPSADTISIVSGGASMLVVSPTGITSSGDVVVANTLKINTAVGNNRTLISDAFGAFTPQAPTNLNFSGVGLNSVQIGTGANANGSESIAIGLNQLAYGTDTIMIGQSSGASTLGNNNIGIGNSVLNSASGAVADCVAIGRSALTGILTLGANNSVAVGCQALHTLTSGDQNTMVGSNSLGSVSLTTGSDNTIMGADITIENASSFNTLIGANTYTFPGTHSSVGIGSASQLSGIGGVAVGASSSATQNDAIAIGNSAICATAYCAQIGQATNSLSSATMKFRTQKVSDEAWISGVENVASIDATGNMKKTTYLPGEASSIKSASTSVSVSSAIAPTTGQVLTAINSTSASWQTPSGGSSALSALSDCAIVGTAEQDLLSWNNTTGKWNNRTVANALKGAGTTSILVGSASVAPGIDNIVIGTSAGSASLSTGCIAIGTDTLDGTITALADCIAIGRGALSGAATFSYTTAVGYNSLNALTSGMSNSAFGASALEALTTGFGNTAIGTGAGSGTNSGASYNTFLGNGAGNAVSTTSFRTCVGYSANSGYDGSTCIGYATADNAGYATLVGHTATTSVTASYTVAVGQGAATVHHSAVAVGAGSRAFGIGTVAVGRSTGASSSTGAVNNTFLGYNSGYSLTTGTDSTFVGCNAGSSIITTGSNNTLLGSGTALDATTRTGCTLIGKGATSTANGQLVLSCNNNANYIRTTLAPDPTPRTASTYLPVTINGVQYYIPLYV